MAEQAAAGGLFYGDPVPEGPWCPSLFTSLTFCGACERNKWATIAWE